MPTVAHMAWTGDEWRLDLPGVGDGLPLVTASGRTSPAARAYPPGHGVHPALYRAAESAAHRYGAAGMIAWCWLQTCDGCRRCDLPERRRSAPAPVRRPRRSPAAVRRLAARLAADLDAIRALLAAGRVEEAASRTSATLSAAREAAGA